MTPAERLVYAASFVASLQRYCTHPEHDQGRLAAKDAESAVRTLRRAYAEEWDGSQAMLDTFRKGE